MEPLEQITVLMTLMKRLAQVMDHERAVLRSMRLDALPEIQDEKEALAEAYEIELGRLRCSPETLAALASTRASRGGMPGPQRGRTAAAGERDTCRDAVNGAARRAARRTTTSIRGERSRTREECSMLSAEC